MPSLEADYSPDTALQRWHTVFKSAFLRRISAEALAAPLKQLHSKYTLSAPAISGVLLDFEAGKGAVDDPLLFHYAQHLLEASYISTGELLLALLERSSFATKPAAGNEGQRISSGLPTREERMFTLLAQLHLNGGLSLAAKDLHQAVYAIARWLRVVHERESNKQLNSDELLTLDTTTCGLCDALGTLALAILGNQGFRSVAKQKWWKQRRPLVVREMLHYDMHVLQWMQSQLSGRLQALTRMPPFVESDPDGRPIISGQQVLESVTELPVAQTRAGLYIWLNACLCGRPLTDEMAMLSHLQARYNGDNQHVAVNLIVASFDVLANAYLKGDPAQRAKMIQSFLCNKVPLLLAMLSTFMPPGATMDGCIQIAFMQISMDALPPLEVGSANVREKLVQARFGFLRACALHQLMLESNIGNILGEHVQLNKIPRFTKDGLVRQCSNNIGQIDGLLDHPTMMQGNAGAVAGCIVDTVNSLCFSKDTMSLKTLCNVLIKHIHDVDIVLQYAQPVNLLQPLCALLNDWTHDQDQSEFTPAYEEYASILIFTLAVIHRYALSEVDAGVAGTQNVVFKLAKMDAANIPPSALTSDQNAQLAKWCEGLFATDEQGETSGISDEVMRQCPPQAFYKLVPTLFEQSVLACRSGALSVETFKSGIELLLEPFLLPSLVRGLGWVAQHSWEDHNDVDILLQLLEKLLKPSSSSQEVQAMHRIVLDMVAPTLLRSLEGLLKKKPEKKAANMLIALLREHLSSTQTGHPTVAEVHDWASNASGGLSQALRNNVRDLVSWASGVGPNPPTRYTHKLYLTLAHLIGPEILIQLFAAEIREHALIGLGPQALDVCVSMICAPQVNPSNQTMSVRDGLQMTLSDTPQLLKKPLTHAEALIRLNRRVEAQLAAPQMAQMHLSMPMSQPSADQIISFGLSDANTGSETAASGGLGQPSEIGQLSSTDFQDANLDSALQAPTNFNGDGAQNVSGDQNVPSADGNLFGDLDMQLDTSGPQIQLDAGDHTNNDGGKQDSADQPIDDDIFRDILGEMGGDFEF
ncbi:mediator complex, subunit Med5 [Hortaea werneckii]|nr:mediator complex, subunit Med5 [Hortaea werneckii]KAI7100805.1 mediator complex, subunit Med5 [Hortaea werneckii]KAI7207256.1 mediator complex, subunit Med5 [Hortaea werneckii]KAI7328507.1 mediator complex, subunit Med5 [Hortaea werneckii]KAI7380759.1 mediator complex, subunit Med5 [Hortaea werneckii]